MSLLKINIKSLILLIAGIIFVQYIGVTCLFANPMPEAGIKIIINETNLVKEGRIFLKDISKIQANGFLKEALEKIELGVSPKPDKIKSFKKNKILSIIKGQRYLPDNIMVTSPERIYVKRMSQTISRQDIRQVVEQKLSKLFQNRDYQLKTFSVKGLEIYPKGDIKFFLVINEMIRKKGKLSFFLDVIIDGKKEDRLSGSGVVAVYENVFHASESHRKGESLSKKNIHLEKKNIFELSDNVIKAFKEIDQKILKSNVKKGDVLKNRFFVDPPLVRKGEIVTLVARNENLLIVTSAISREDGFENGLIKVENISSGKLIRCIVKGKSKVEVAY